MSVDTQPAPAPAKPSYPEVKSIHRIASVPLVHDGLASLDAIITKYSYSNSVKVWAQAWGSQAYKISEPYGAKLAPVIVSADGMANQGLDFVQRRFPYPFIAPTDEIIQKVRAPADQAYGIANAYVGAGQKAVNERVIAPAIGAAQNADKQLSPYLDSFEARVRPYVPPRNDDAPTETESGKTTAARAYDLSLDVRARAVSLTQEQFAHLQQSSVLIQRASDTVSHLAGAAKEQSQTLAHQLLQTLDSLQQSTSKLPGELQGALQPFSDQLGATYKHMLDVSHEPISIGEKTVKLAGAAQDGLAEVLGMAAERVQRLLGWAREEASKKKAEANGNAAKLGDAVEARADQVGQAAKDGVDEATQ